MQSQPSPAPRPSAISVGEYYENAFVRVLTGLITEWTKNGAKTLELECEDDALRTMLRDLSGARAGREKHYQSHAHEMSAETQEWMELLYPQGRHSRQLEYPPSLQVGHGRAVRQHRRTHPRRLHGRRRGGLR